MNLFRIVLKRLLNGLPLLLFLPLLTFLAMQLVSGNYFDVMRMDPQISADTIRQYEKLYHLDQPAGIQYLIWLRNLCRLDFGYSFAYKRPVLEILGSRMANTLLLTVTSFILAWFLAVLLGLWAGFRSGGWLDRIMSLGAYLALSIPGFFLCLLLLCGACQWTSLPLGGMKSFDYEELTFFGKGVDMARHALIPVLVLTLGSVAQLFRVMKAQTQEIQGRDFVLFLRACGVPERKILFKHVARNALNPMVSLFGLSLPSLFSGAALVEIFTGWPGIGQMMLQAVRTQDLFLVLGNIVMISVLLIAGNLLADIALMVLDPRIKLEKEVV